MDITMTQLTSGELIESQGAIIAGLLVLLTVSAFYDQRVYSHFWGRPIFWLAFSPIPFVVSIAMLVQGATQPQIALSYYEYSTTLFIGGLSYIMIAIPLAFIIMAKTLKN